MAESIQSLKKKLDTMVRELSLREESIASLNSEIKTQRKLYVALQEKMTKYEEENQRLKKEVSTSYTPEELSTYFNQTIEVFNKNRQSDTDQAKYIINSMDVDLKTYIYADGQGKMRCSSPALNTNSEEGLSSIKISIRAVPK